MNTKRKKVKINLQKMATIGIALIFSQITGFKSHAFLKEEIYRFHQSEHDKCLNTKFQLGENYTNLRSIYENKLAAYRNYDSTLSSARADSNQKYNVLKRFESPLESLNQLRFKLENVANIAGQLDSTIYNLSFQTENNPLFKLIDVLENSGRSEAINLANSLRTLQSSYRDPISQALRLSGAAGLAGALKMVSTSLNPIISELRNNYATASAEYRNSKRNLDSVQNWSDHLYNKVEEYRNQLNSAVDAYNNWSC